MTARHTVSCAFTLVRVVLVVMVGGAAVAADIGSDRFSFNAFGTLGLVHSSEDQADFTSSTFKPTGAGYSHEWSADVDSLVGVQWAGVFTSQLSASVQIIAEQNYNDDYRPEVQWANIKYAFTPDLNLRVGRVVLPNFLLSDTQKVGYANPWVRPPVEVYGGEPLKNSDGVDLSYRLHLGDFSSTLSTTYSRNDRLDFAAGYSAQTRDLHGVFTRTEYGAAVLNVSYAAAHGRIEPPTPLFEDFAMFGPQGMAIAGRYALEDKLVSIAALGASYDPGQWYGMAELTRINTRSISGISTGWYASGGYRIAKFTPYLTYSAVTVARTTDPGLNVASLPPYLAGTATALNAGLQEGFRLRPVQRTLSAGARWDFAKNFDLKLQCDHERLGPGSPGTLINTQPGFRPGGTVNLFSVAVDTVL